MVRSLALPQKVALVIGLAAAAVLVAAYVATDGFRNPGGGGWFAYPDGSDASATDMYFAVSRPSAVRTLWAPLALIAAWTAASVWVLGRPKSPPEP